MKFLLYVLCYPINGVRYYRKLKKRYAQIDREHEIWKNYLAAPSNVKIKNNYKW